MRTLVGTIALATAIFPVAHTALAAAPSDKDSKYFTEKAHGLMTEVELGKIAEKQGQDDRIKEFGRRMVTDHSKDLDNLKQLASQKNVKLPESPDDDQQKEIKKLTGMSGKSFDQEYIKYEIKDHKKDVKDDNKLMKETSDSDLKKFATDSHKTVSTHLDIANDIEKKIKASK